MIELFSEEDKNVVAQALIDISDAEDFKDNEKIYKYLAEAPKTSLVSELVDGIRKLGYKIIKVKIK